MYVFLGLVDLIIWTSLYIYPCNPLEKEYFPNKPIYVYHLRADLSIKATYSIHSKMQRLNTKSAIFEAPKLRTTHTSQLRRKEGDREAPLTHTVAAHLA